ncbi:MAG TPA: hypothetical protein VF103_19125 [Polyangiaceae bacterium]
MPATAPFFEVSRLDSELVRLGRGASALHLDIGAALEALASRGGHHELGFSSLEAYARERCERTGRWAVDTRALAKRLRPLPRIESALRAGAIGWSTAELLARYVTAESEVLWLERARGTTLRELRAELNGRPDGKGSASETLEDSDSEDTCVLTVTVQKEDAWIFVCAGKVAETVGGPMPHDRLLTALLAEAHSTLLELVSRDECPDLHELERVESEVADEAATYEAWHGELRRWRDEAEELCRGASESLAECDLSAPGTASHSAGAVAETPEALDREIGRLCSDLSERDLALGIVAERARKAEVWRRLGFSSEAQYARERVGVSLSSLKAKRILAARGARVPELAEALATGRIGYEAAYLLSRIVTPGTAGDWIRRAERRTVKHLREEVEAAELLVRLGLGREQAPLEASELEPLTELERCIASGELLEQTEVASPDAPFVGQISGTRRAGRREAGFGRVTMRWLVNEGTRRRFRALERVYARIGSRVCRVPVSFVRFLCENFCRIWLPALRRERLTESGDVPDYFSVYRRDVFRCASPVCTRRDITPHHLRFRARGGGDEDENVVSLCVFCHLHGVHAGRIAVEPPASHMRWRIGRAGTLRVEGRTRVTA